VVHGFRVPDGQQPFDISVRVLQGNGITLRGMPIGAVKANIPIEFTARVNTPYTNVTAAALEGLLLIGPPSMPYLLEVPITIQPTVLIYPKPRLEVDSAWVGQTARLFTLSFQNQGIYSEQVNAKIVIPPGLVYLSNSVSADHTAAVFDPITRTLTWEGEVGSAETIMINYIASADPQAASGPAVTVAEVIGINTGQKWKVDLTVWLNSFGTFLPFIQR
jgi:hypothetical protein